MDLDVVALDKGEGTGWTISPGPPGPDARVDRYWEFTPPVTGNYRLTANQRFNGFYILKADDGIFTSKEAVVYLHGSIEVYQYYWQRSEFSVFSKRGDNIDKQERYDSYFQANIDVALGGADLVIVQLTQEFDVWARGGGSYAELNFKDGNANTVRRPVLYGTDYRMT